MPKPRDRREYVRISVNLPGHPKLAQLDSPAASWLYVVGICWCGEHLTDGHLQPRIVERLAGVPAKWTQALVVADLWHEAGHSCTACPQPDAGQIMVHDYLQHQRSRDESDQARSAARSAADARWDAKGMRRALPSASPEQCRSDAEVEVEVEEEKIKTNPPSPSGMAPPPSRRRGIRIPDDFQPTPELITWARTNCPDVPKSEHEAFADYWTAVPGAKGEKLDWNATWRTWMRRCQTDIRSGRRPPATGKRSTTDDRVAMGLALAAKYDAEDGTTLATIHQIGGIA